MQAIDQFVNDLESKLPPICTDADLIQLGLVSAPTLCRIRKGGNGPAYLRIRRKIIYLRSDILTWVRSSYFNNKIDSEDRCRRS